MLKNPNQKPQKKAKTKINEKIENFLTETYFSVYDKVYSETKGSDYAKESVAQVEAVEESAKRAMDLFPEATTREIWECLSTLHTCRKCGISPEIYRRTKSASQSWNKVSGDAFEKLVQAAALKNLPEQFDVFDEIEMTYYLDRDYFDNRDKNDLQFLKDNKVRFDLYIVAEDDDGKKYLFGVIQCKTSFRDRVVRDVPFSQNAMSKNFWSVGFGYISDNFFGKKDDPSIFERMVDFGRGFTDYGYHNYYLFSNEKCGRSTRTKGTRVYWVSKDLKPFTDHIEIAWKKWKHENKTLNSKWNLEDDGLQFS